MRQILSSATSRAIGLVILGIVALVPLARMLTGNDFAFYLLQFGPPVAAALFLGVSAALLGSLFVPAMERGIERLALSAALGLGIFGLGFAVAHLLRLPMIVYISVLVLVGWIGGLVRVRNAEMGRLESLPHFTIPEMAAVVVLVLAGAMAFVASLTPPLSYDVLEYHLPLVRSWIQTNSLGDIPYNFYTLLPAGTEALFAVASWLARTLAAAKVANFLLLCATALTVAALAVRMGASRLFALLAAAHFCLHATTVRIYIDAFADMGAALFVAASALALLVWADEREWRWAALAGALAGFAVGAKSSTAGVFVAPALVFAFFIPGFHSRGDGGPRPTLHVPAFLFVAAIAFLPWMVRGYQLTGNPASPFLNSIFGADPWRVETERLWLAMHGWTHPFSGEHLAAIFHKVRLIGWPWIGGVIAALFLCRNGARGLSLIALSGYFVYTLLTGAPDRFAEPIIALAIALTAAAASIGADAMLRTRPVVVAISFLLLWSPLWGAIENMVGMKNLDYVLTADEETYEKPYIAYDFFSATGKLPANAEILVLYEAQTFLIERQNTANTVFDKSPLLEILRTGKGDSLGQKIKAAGYTHFMVNEVELARLIDMQASPATSHSPLYQQIHSIPQTPIRYRQYSAHLEWYLPYERMKATQQELGEIRQLTGMAESHL